MKHALLVFVFFASCSFVHGQYLFKINKVAPAQVPQAVKATHHQKFPKAGAVDRWEKHIGIGKYDKRTRYVAIYKANGKRARARYTPEGRGLTATIYYLAPGLPPKVKTKAAAKHPNFDVKGGQKIYLFGQDKTVYRVRMRKGAAVMIIYIDPDGNEVSGSSIPDEAIEDESLVE